MGCQHKDHHIGPGVEDSGGDDGLGPIFEPSENKGGKEDGCPGGIEEEAADGDEDMADGEAGAGGPVGVGKAQKGRWDVGVTVRGVEEIAESGLEVAAVEILLGEGHQEEVGQPPKQ